MNVVKKIAVLLTCYNRKEKTLSCLKSLYAATLPRGFIFDVFLVDDGSNDGTSEAVIKKYPDIKVIVGDGSLFWSRGMHLAWQTAAKTKDYDFYLWLNDDTTLYKLGLQNMLSVVKNETIVVGATVSISNHKITYGGRIIKKGLIGISDTVQECDYFNGNLVLIPKTVFELIGFNDYKFHHGLGDFDYGLRAGKKNINLLVAPNFSGFCELNTTRKSWQIKKMSFSQRYRLFKSPLGNNPEEYFLFDFRHNGVFSAVSHYCLAYIRLLYCSI